MFKINCIHFTELLNGHIWLRSIINIAISYFTTSLWVGQWFHCIMYHIFLIIERSKMHKTNNKFSTIYSFVVVYCWVKHSSRTVPLSDQECFINWWMMNSMGKGVTDNPEKFTPIERKKSVIATKRKGCSSCCTHHILENLICRQSSAKHQFFISLAYMFWSFYVFVYYFGKPFLLK